MVKEVEIAKLHSDLSKAVTTRYELLSQHLPENIRMRKKGALKTARANMKRLKYLETDFWHKKLDECQSANKKGYLGSMYRILRQLEAQTVNHHNH